MKKYYWERKNISPDIHEMLEIFSIYYPLREGRKKNCIEINAEKVSDYENIRIIRNEVSIKIFYPDIKFFGRALGTVLSGLIEKEHEEKVNFRTLGIMIDCSRNAVFTVKYLKEWLRQLSLLGYNSVMLYLEDIYELPGEEYFGYMRGRYTAEELKEIDRYALTLGIEMIPCIQTLGHLGKVMRWNIFNDIKDTSSVLLAGEAKSYLLIEKMVTFFKEVFKTKRIHVGMDEAHDIGRGKFIDKFGYEEGYEIFRKHLDHVANICGKYYDEIMIWSDMYFRLGSKTGDYYDKNVKIPETVMGQVPKNVKLVYWDYYHDNEDFYTDWIKKHIQIKDDLPVMCSAVWSWAVPWYGKEYTEKNLPPAVNACKKEGIKDIFFTMWNDNGAACDFGSNLAGVTFASECAYSDTTVSKLSIQKRFNAICDADYEAHIKAAGMNDEFSALGLLWDDPLLGIYWHDQLIADNKCWDIRLDNYRNIILNLEKMKNRKGAGSCKHIILILKYLKLKIEIQKEIEKFIKSKIQFQYQELIKKVKAASQLLKKIRSSYRKIWLSRYKPFGLEVLQIRISGQIERLHEMSRRFDDFRNGLIDSIPEIEERKKTTFHGYISYRYNYVSSSAGEI